MSEIVIQNFLEVPVQQREQVLFEVNDIFFESSTKKEFKDQEEKDKFQLKYLGYYLHKYPQYVWIATTDERVMGYVCGAPQTAKDSLYEIQPHLKEFQDFYERFPAHLHVNCHADSRGKGVGRKLVLAFEATLKKMGVAGVHIMTGPESRNRSFYKGLGYTFEAEQSQILFMGKSLK